ncbi:hybrid NRPS/PKS enzyme [Penicillium hordei]|uniref:Hybrid NRPS/PKS enzyme n=1 Tax=Penicillium hordei TaxID=40994 RepID=A0AAD6DU48_9EURO|nr:hybrid NRPS/PKS enzyme [Penicillium hordei]KAJ5593216.1 hybrid NRPS/PKS enzyme [Penicillium hordei]
MFEANTGSLARYLRVHANTDLGRLVYTLFRRTDFPFRAALHLRSNLQTSSRTATIPKVLPPQILCTFTSKGAQWATLG